MKEFLVYDFEKDVLTLYVSGFSLDNISVGDIVKFVRRPEGPKLLVSMKVVEIEAYKKSLDTLYSGSSGLLFLEGKILPNPVAKDILLIDSGRPININT